MTATVAARAASVRKQWVLASCCMSLLIIGLDNTIVNVALPAISHSLGAGVAELQWVVDAYILVLASLYLLGGWLGDRFGRRRIFIIGLSLFVGASAVCSLAVDVPTLAVFRALQAVGGAMLNPVALGILANTFTDPKERARAIGIWGSVVGVSMAVGPVLGGVLVELLGWRAVFWVNVPIGLLAIVLTVLHIPASRADGVRRFDVPGQLLVLVFLGSLLYGIIEAPHVGWAAPSIVGAYLLAVAALIGLIRVESRRRDPLVDPRFFRSVPFVSAGVVAIVAFLAFGGLLFAGTLYLQAGRGFSPLQAGLCLVPVAVMTIVMSPLSGILVGRYGGRPSFLIAAAAFGVSGLMLTQLRVETGLPWLLVAFALFGVGFGAINPPVTTTAVEGMPRRQAGVAGATIATSRQVGQALGVAVAGALIGGVPAAGEEVSSAAWWLIPGAAVLIAVIGWCSTTPAAHRSAAQVRAAHFADET